jgi:hypothetical protein
MGENLFDSLETIAAGDGGQTHWAARAPYRPESGFDLMLVPRVPDWWDHDDSRQALEQAALLLGVIGDTLDAVLLRCDLALGDRGKLLDRRYARDRLCARLRLQVWLLVGL